MPTMRRQIYDYNVSFDVVNTLTETRARKEPQSATAISRRRFSVITTTNTREEKQLRFEHSMGCWVVVDQQSFKVVDNEELQNMAELLHKTVVVPGEHTIKICFRILMKD